MSFATQLKKLRARHHVTQQTLADYLNVTRPTIAGYETKRKEPDYATLLLLSTYFNVSTDYLLTGKNFPESIQSPLTAISKRPIDVDFNSNLINLLTRLEKNIANMETADLNRLLEYSELLLSQPYYQKNK